MALEDTVNEDFTFSVTKKGSMVPGITSGDQYKCEVIKDSNCECPSGKKVLIDKLDGHNPLIHTNGVRGRWGCGAVNEAACSSSGGSWSWITNGSWTINASSIDNELLSKKPFRKGDKTSMDCSCSAVCTPPSGPPVPVTGNCSIEITSAGQTNHQCS